MTFLCQRDYQESGETYTIKEMSVKALKNGEQEETNIEKKKTNDESDGDGEVKLIIMQHLQDSTIATYTNFLYSRVPPSTPQIIDTLLNMRADQEYLEFLTLAANLFKE
jgi:hypothetical protein